MARYSENIKYLSIFTNCRPVKGAARSIIYDLQRSTFDFIPNDLHDIIVLHAGKRMSELYTFFKESDHEIIDDYIDFLLEKEYAYLAEDEQELSCFPDMDLNFYSPSVISNAIIDFRFPSLAIVGIENYKKLISDLSELGCRHIQLRFFDCLPKIEIKSVLVLFEEGDFCVELLIKDSREMDVSDFTQLYSEYTKLFSLTIFSSQKCFDTEQAKSFPYILFTDETVLTSDHCGVIHPSYFVVSNEMFTESLSHNSCLNRKIGIDEKGDIKNCPTLLKSYGNLREKGIKDVLAERDFTELWNVNKDQISTCKICEFRYMCSDCRAHCDNQYDKPVKCTYDPYQMTWSGNEYL
jgi:SPASM domain peptide maturase of grasp-with-spasm system